MSAIQPSPKVLEVARKLYSEWTDNQGIHCNRFPSWEELTKMQRNEWLVKAAKGMKP